MPYQLRKAGDWNCTACGWTGNFGSRTQCRSCKAPNPAASRRAKDWSCSCGFSNFGSRFGSRTQCRSCKAPNPAASRRAKDWSCSCGFSNFGSRESCRRCLTPKAGATASAAAAATGISTGISTGVLGEIVGMVAGAVSGAVASHVPSALKRQNNDWTCDCGYVNFGSHGRSSCGRCGSSREQTRRKVATLKKQQAELTQKMAEAEAQAKEQTDAIALAIANAKAAEEQANEAAEAGGAKMCSVCLAAPVANKLLVHAGDTGHQCCCDACIAAIRSSSNRCPICRAEILAVVKVF
jgi:hypothetical protein